MRSFRVIVVGAGMAGLAAARRLARRGAQVTVLEQGERVGGRVKSWTVGERTIDLGAQFIASPYAYTWRLFAGAGLNRSLTHRARLSGIVRDGTIYPLQPDTRALLSPLLTTSERAALLRLVTPILAHWNQLDVYHPEKADTLDTESFAAYITGAGDRDLRDLLEAFFEPILSGLLYWDAERTSQAMVFLLLKASTRQPTFLTLNGGLAQLPEAVAASLDVRCRSQVSQVGDDGAGGYEVHARADGGEQVFAADGIVCATPAPVVPRLFPSLDVTRRRFFEAIDYSSTAVAAVGLPRPLPVRVFSLFFPRASGGRVAAITVDSNKDRSRRPRGPDIVEIFASDGMARELRSRDDAAAQEALWTALCEAGIESKIVRDVLQASAEPEFLGLQRWDQALPRFDVGHFHRLRAFAAGEIEPGRIVFAGDYLIGPHIEGAVVSGIRAADRLLCLVPRASR